jgi:hypothetical protein
VLRRRTHDYEGYREHDEAHELNGLASPGVDEQESHPVSRNKTGHREDEVTDANVMEILVDSEGAFGKRSAEANGLENDRRVEAESVEGNLNENMSY